jgi:hypothetical protein
VGRLSLSQRVYNLGHGSIQLIRRISRGDSAAARDLPSQPFFLHVRILSWSESTTEPKRNMPNILIPNVKIDKMGPYMKPI